MRILWCYLRFKQRIFAYKKFRKTIYFSVIFTKVPVLCRKHCNNRPHASCHGRKNFVRSVFNLSSVLSLELWLVAGGMLVQISVFSTIWCKLQHLGAMCCRLHEEYGALPHSPHNQTTKSTKWPMPHGTLADHARWAVRMGRRRKKVQTPTMRIVYITQLCADRCANKRERPCTQHDL